MLKKLCYQVQQQCYLMVTTGRQKQYLNSTNIVRDKLAAQNYWIQGWDGEYFTVVGNNSKTTPYGVIINMMIITTVLLFRKGRFL